MLYSQPWSTELPVIYIHRSQPSWWRLTAFVVKTLLVKLWIPWKQPFWEYVAIINDSHSALKWDIEWWMSADKVMNYDMGSFLALPLSCSHLNCRYLYVPFLFVPLIISTRGGRSPWSIKWRTVIHLIEWAEILAKQFCKYIRNKEHGETYVSEYMNAPNVLSTLPFVCF